MKVLLMCISHRLGCRYYIGEWKNEQFYPESHGLMNWPGGRFFANDSFLDDRQCVTQRIYPSRDDALGVSLFCKGGPAKVLSLKAWDMAATNAW